jgi:hypothetical protein
MNGILKFVITFPLILLWCGFMIVALVSFNLLAVGLAFLFTMGLFAVLGALNPRGEKPVTTGEPSAWQQFCDLPVAPRSPMSIESLEYQTLLVELRKLRK